VITGTLINSLTILIASLIGLAVGSKLGEEIRRAIVNVLGLAVMLIGIRMALQTENILVPTLSVVIGTAVGELSGIEKGLEAIGNRFEGRMKGKFSEGFVAATILYCVGPMAILGPIQEGLTGDMSILLAKSLLDGVASIALASALGAGVALSSLSVFIYQGFFALLAAHISGLITENIVKELTSTGGLLIMGIGFNLLEIKKLRVGNMLPSLIFAPIILTAFQLSS